MNSVGPGIPSTSALLAFEATARLGSMAHAAEELEVSSPAISRHISKLERALNVRLFERKGRGLTLTSGGKDYFVAVQSSIQCLRAATIKLHENKATLIIVCSQGTSAMLLLPLCRMLKSILDKDVDLQMLNYQHGMVPLLLPVGVDLCFEYSTARSDENSERLLEEEIAPVVAPAFMNRFRQEFSEHPSRWLGVTRLELAPSGANHATWETWFESLDCHPPETRVETYENYLYLAEAAAKGHGIALGWNGFVNSYIETGRLVPIQDKWLHTKAGLYGVLTTAGQGNPIARRFLTELAGLTRELRIGSDKLKSIRERWAG